MLIGYVTAGTGHRRAAEALAQAVRARDPQAEVACLDVLADAPGRFAAFYDRTYLLMVRHLSGVWKLSYGLLDQPWVYRLVQPLRRRWNRWIARRFIDRVKAWRPDVVLATHFLPADLCNTGRAGGWLSAPLVVVVTDWHPHRFWLAPAADAMVVSTAHAAAVLERRGIARDRIRVVGIPIGRAFLQPPAPAALRRRFALQPGRQTVLVTSGGTTVGQFARVVRALAELERVIPGRLQLVVVCGEDHAMQRRLGRFAQTCAMPMRVFDFVDFMAELMAVSDLAVAKAGGLTVSEALSCGLPLVLYHVIPGQERLNAAYVERHGAARIARGPGEVAARVRELIGQPTRLAAMRAAARTLSHPDAAARIISEIVEPLAR